MSDATRLPSVRASECESICDYAKAVGMWPEHSCVPSCEALQRRDEVRVQINVAIREAIPWVQMCGSCDAGVPLPCSCPKGDPRPVILALFEALLEATTSQTKREPVPVVEQIPSLMTRLGVTQDELTDHTDD